ncbi:MAG: TnpV protein [Clostridiales bacterium]|nr:TnpV protein [Clostridiales bacterium]
MRKKLAPGEIEEISFNMDDEEFNKLLDDMEKLQSDEPVIVDGVLYGDFGGMTEEDYQREMHKELVPKPNYNYMLSPWYGKARDEFLKATMKEELYMPLKNLGILQWHLIEINERAYDMEEKLIAEISAKEGVNAELKMRDQLGWVRKYNNIRARAREIIQHELINVETYCLHMEDVDMEYLKEKGII